MDESQRPAERWDDLLAAIATRGVVINLLVPLALLAVGYLLRRAGVTPDTPALEEATHRLVLYILGAVAVGELAAASYVKKMMLRPSRFAEINGSFAAFAERCKQSIALVFAICAAPAVYGFALYALGGTIEQFIFFLLISLIGFRFLRPGKDRLEKLWADVSGDADSASSS